MNPDAPGLMTIQNGFAIVDYDRYDLASPAATSRCPTGAIVWVEGAQFSGAPAHREREAS